MSVLTLRPNSDSTPLQQNPSTSGSHYVLIDEVTKDEADYINLIGLSEGNAITDIYGFPDHTTESGTINSVTIKAYCKYVLTGTCTNNATFNPAVKIGSTVYYGGAQNLTNTTALYSYTWTTNPATTSAWSWTEIDALLAGDALKNGYTDKDNWRRPYNYQLWVEVDYTAGGGRKSLLNSLLRKPFRHMLIR